MLSRLIMSATPPHSRRSFPQLDPARTWEESEGPLQRTVYVSGLPAGLDKRPIHQILFDVVAYPDEETPVTPAGPAIAAAPAAVLLPAAAPPAAVPALALCGDQPYEREDGLVDSPRSPHTDVKPAATPAPPRQAPPAASARPAAAAAAAAAPPHASAFTSGPTSHTPRHAHASQRRPAHLYAIPAWGPCPPQPHGSWYRHDPYAPITVEAVMAPNCGPCSRWELRKVRVKQGRAGERYDSVFVEFATVDEAQDAMRRWSGRTVTWGGGTSSVLLASPARHPIAGGSSTDYDPATFRPCVFGWSQSEIDTINLWYRFDQSVFAPAPRVPRRY